MRKLLWIFAILCFILAGTIVIAGKSSAARTNPTITISDPAPVVGEFVTFSATGLNKGTPVAVSIVCAVVYTDGLWSVVYTGQTYLDQPIQLTSSGQCRADLQTRKNATLASVEFNVT